MKKARNQKWVRKAGPRERAVDVARRVLEQRVEAVQHYLDLAARRPGENIEHVHQLRVSTRRASAACSVFKDLTRTKRLGPLTRELRRLRRMASAARDLDVLCERLSKEAGDPSRANLDRAVVWVQRRRQEVQKPLCKASRGWAHGKQRRKVQRLLRSGLWRKSTRKQRFGGVSRRVLASAVERFFAATSADLSNLESLHEMRIQGKRLRYTIEVVASCFDKRLGEEIYPCVEEVQERLGAVNDHGAAQQMFAGWLGEVQDETLAEIFGELAKIEGERAEAARQEFLQWWNVGRARSLQELFAELLDGDSETERQRGEAVAEAAVAPVAEDAVAPAANGTAAPEAAGATPQSAGQPEAPVSSTPPASTPARQKSKGKRSKAKKQRADREALANATANA
jgi:CHAD domain-containing protein